jgi:hypothetical protein
LRPSGNAKEGQVKFRRFWRSSGAWVKFKISKFQQFVIGGYMLPEESLLVGYNSPDGLCSPRGKKRDRSDKRLSKKNHVQANAGGTRGVLA